MAFEGMRWEDVSWIHLTRQGPVVTPGRYNNKLFGFIRGEEYIHH
jgi:hypothetical protein